MAESVLGKEVSVKFIGLRRYRRMIDRHNRIDDRIQKNIVRAGTIVEREAKRAIKGSRTRALRMGRLPTAASGVLGVDTGRLRQSITTEERRSLFFNRVYTLHIGPVGVPYARIHELGDRKRGMPKRPYMAVAIKKTADRVERMIGRSFKVVTG